MKFIHLILLFFLIISCSRSSLLEQSLILSKENRMELEKVLYHYKYINPDLEKLQAAEFLISNMSGWYSRVGEEVEKFNAIVDSLFKLPVTLSGKEFAFVLDSALSVIKCRQPQFISDLDTITADYLINAIDQAFETHKYPWCELLDIQTFFEYVLPYRLGTEILEDWRAAYVKLLGGKIDSLVCCGASDSIVGKYLMEYYTGQIAYELTSPRSELRPTVLLNIKTGDCVDYSHFTVYLCRAFGIPASCDFVPCWGNGSGKHQWGVLLRPNSACIPFNVTDHVVFGEHVAGFTKIPPKIYRRTTSIQKNNLPFKKLKEDIPVFFKSLYYKDVSGEYFKTVDISIHLTIAPPQEKKIAYIMVFDNKSWQPVDWAEIKQGEAVFTQMSPLCAYMVMYYHNGNFFPASYPFYLNEQLNPVMLKPQDNKMDSVILKRKYSDKRVQMFSEKMLGGKFQVANNPDFSDSLTIFEINEMPNSNFNTKAITKQGSYLYFRYLSPPFSSCNVAEIELYDETGDLITGKIIGTDGSYGEGNMDKTKVFDQKVLTFFDAPIFTGAWVGLEFSKPKTISKLVYLPRNDDNFIRDGEQYELFYWDVGWNTLGQQIGNVETQQLVYNNVPQNSLLLLRNLTRGVEERIFTYEDNKQVWW